MARNKAKQAVANYAGEGQWNPQLLSGSEGETNIFQSKRRDETCRREFPIGDYCTVSLVNGGVEKCGREEVKVLMLIETSLPYQGHRFSERFDHGSD
jgi:hypothetical protein